MNDVRAKFYGFLEKLAEEMPEKKDEILSQKDSMKAWVDNEVELKVKANQDRDDTIKRLDDANLKITELEEATKNNDVGGADNPRIAELENTVKKLQEDNEKAQKEKEQLQKETEQTQLRSKFLGMTNLKDDIAEDKVELALTRGHLVMQDGKPGGLVDGVFTPMEQYVKTVDEANSSYLKVVTGGKDGGFNQEPPNNTPKSTAEKAVEAIEASGGSMPEAL